MNIIIPAAGCSKRMNGLGPKALVNIKGEPLICRQIRILNDIFTLETEITIVVGSESQKIIQALPKQRNINIVYNELNEITNVARSIYLGMIAHASHNSLIIYGDLVFNEDVIRSFFAKNRSFLVLDKGKSRKGEVGCTTHQDGSVLHLEYGLKTKWAHIAYLAGKDKYLFMDIAGREESKKLFGYEIFNKMLDQTEIYSHVLGDECKLVEIDRPQDIVAAKRVFK